MRLTAVRVDVAELNVREEPSTSAKRLATVEEGTLFVLDGYGPIAADGYAWWAASRVTNDAGGELPPLPAAPETSVGVRGYIAVARGAMPYVEPVALRCPVAIDLGNVVGMLPGERALCFGDRGVTVDGTLTCGPCEGHGPPETYEPAWLADSRVGLEIAVSGTGAHFGLRLHLPPEVAPAGTDALPGAPLGSILRVAGHFNDPRSASCEIALYVDDQTSHVVADTDAEQACRQHYVVDSYEVLGNDPAYIRPF